MKKVLLTLIAGIVLASCSVNKQETNGEYIFNIFKELNNISLQEFEQKFITPQEVMEMTGDIIPEDDFHNELEEIYEDLKEDGEYFEIDISIVKSKKEYKIIEIGSLYEK